MSDPSIIYVHYGTSFFDPDLFVPPKNGNFIGKPQEFTGLWASRDGDPFGWKAWCEKENYCECSEDNCFRFTLAQDANIIELIHPDQLDNLPQCDPSEIFPFVDLVTRNHVYLDFEAMMAEGIDGIELFWSPLFREALWGWDCNCLLMMNKDVIVPL